VDGLWLEKSRRCLEAAELLLREGYADQAIELAWLSMACAVRGLLAQLGPAPDRMGDLPSLYVERLLPRLRISPENRRAFTIVSNLRESVFVTGEEGDPLTARACLDDASAFLRELSEVSLTGGEEGGQSGGEEGFPDGPYRGRGLPGTAKGAGSPPPSGLRAPGTAGAVSLEKLARLLLGLREETDGRG